MDLAELKSKLADEGYPHIYEWRDAPGATYHAHAHKDKVSMYILEGSVTFSFAGKEVVLNAGDQFDVPAGEEHTAKVGEQGCYFLVGEMIEGDS